MPSDTASNTPDVNDTDLPKDVSARLKYWYGTWYQSAQMHYLLGVISVAASVVSTSTEGNWAKGFSTLAAITTAMIGFIHPERRYMKFVRAWRLLDVAAMRYRHGLIDKGQLIDAVEKGEAAIAEFEDRYSAADAAAQASDAAKDRAAVTAAAAAGAAADAGAAASTEPASPLAAKAAATEGGATGDASPASTPPTDLSAPAAATETAIEATPASDAPSPDATAKPGT